MRLSEQQAAFASDVAKLITWIFGNGHSVTLGEAFRTEEQAAIYAKEGKGIKDSLHCKRLAIDLNLFDFEGHYLSDSKSYEEFGIFWESLHPKNRWGGRWHPTLANHHQKTDGNHFERELE